MEWQPIETAPKDGTLILVFAIFDGADWSVPGVVEAKSNLAGTMMDFARWDSEALGSMLPATTSWEAAIRSANLTGVHVTHWARLPGPPNN